MVQFVMELTGEQSGTKDGQQPVKESTRIVPPESKPMDVDSKENSDAETPASEYSIVKSQNFDLIH